MKTILITGAGGFIGGELARKISSEKPDVTIKAMVHSGKKSKAALEAIPNCSIFQGDIVNPLSFEDQLRNVDQIYHLAAFAKVWNPDPNTFYRINVEGTKNVLDAAVKHNVKRVVITSTAGTFGPQFNNQLVTETIQQPLPPFTEYERTKLEALKLAKSYSSHIEVVFVSPTRVYGPGELSVSNAATKVMDQYVNKGLRFVPGDGKKVGNYVFVEDIIEGHMLAMKNGKNGENYILGGENLTYLDMFQQIGEIAGIQRKMIPTPIPIMMAGARSMEFMANTFKKEPIILPPFIRKYTHDWGTDISKAQQEIGYTVTPFKEGVKKTLEWLRSNREHLNQAG